MESVSRDVRISRFSGGFSISLVGENWREVRLCNLDGELFGIPAYLCTYTVTYTLDAMGKFIVSTGEGSVRRVILPIDDDNVFPVCFLPLDWAGRRVSIVRTNIRRDG